MVELLKTTMRCRKCGKPLDLEEMHYYAEEDGSATCNDCESQWLHEITDWKNGQSEMLPQR